MAIDEARAAIARDRAGVVQDRGAPRGQALPADLDGHRPSRRRARAGRTGPGRRRPHARAAAGDRGRHRRRVRLRRHARRAGRAARRARRAARCCCCRAASTRPSRAGWRRSAASPSTPIYFHSPPYIGEKSRDKVLALGKQLARWQALRSVTVVPFTEVQKRLRDAGPAELAVVLYRRMMLRIADAVADKLEAERAGHRREPGPGRQPDDREPDRHRGGRAAGRAAAASSPTTRSRPRRSRAASAPTRRRSCPSRTAARCSCRRTRDARARRRTPSASRRSWTSPAEIAAAVAGSERIVV